VAEPETDADVVADVVVIGGGPGGSVCASQLVRKGLSVIVLEKVSFPRFHLGESLLPQSLPILEEIGVLDAVRKTFLPKYGARFHDDTRKKKDRFGFDGAWKPEGLDHAFQVPRDAFDAMLLDHARSLGADVRHLWTVTKILTDTKSGRASGVVARAPDGDEKEIAARFVVDASGRDALMAHATKSTTKIPGLDQTAFYAHFEGIPRQAGKLEGDIDIVLFASAPGEQEEEEERPNWFWFIPFKDGRTSVGAVVSLAWMRAKRKQSETTTTSELFAMAVAESTTATELLANAKCLWPHKEAAADFSYRVRSVTGPGWVAIGDAGGFIDPLFSTGAHRAMTGGKLAADAIVAALALPSSSAEEEERALFDAWEARVRAAAETFILAVQSFYAGPLASYLFVEDKHEVVRRSITSLLAGDVFGDAIWLRDTRLRLQEMLAPLAP
jgi:flavin-dependent dehydrogenase